MKIYTYTEAQITKVRDALEALQRYDGTLTGKQVAEAISILDAPVVQKPVAVLTDEGVMGVKFTEHCDYGCGLKAGTPLYIAPQEETK